MSYDFFGFLMQQILILISNHSRNYLECPLMTDMKHADRKEKLLYFHKFFNIDYNTEVVQAKVK